MKSTISNKIVLGILVFAVVGLITSSILANEVEAKKKKFSLSISSTGTNGANGQNGANGGTSSPAISTGTNGAPGTNAGPGTPGAPGSNG